MKRIETHGKTFAIAVAILLTLSFLAGTSFGQTTPTQNIKPLYSAPNLVQKSVGEQNSGTGKSVSCSLNSTVTKGDPLLFEVAVTNQGYSQVTMNTPTDSGQFKSSWVSENSSSTFTYDVNGSMVESWYAVANYTQTGLKITETYSEGEAIAGCQELTSSTTSFYELTSSSLNMINVAHTVVQTAKFYRYTLSNDFIVFVSADWTHSGNTITQQSGFTALKTQAGWNDLSYNPSYSSQSGPFITDSKSSKYYASMAIAFPTNQYKGWDATLNGEIQNAETYYLSYVHNTATTGTGDAVGFTYSTNSGSSWTYSQIVSTIAGGGYLSAAHTSSSGTTSEEVWSADVTGNGPYALYFATTTAISSAYTVASSLGSVWSVGPSANDVVTQAAGLYWVFYTDGTNEYYTTSSTGSSWSSPTQITTSGYGSNLHLWFNGTNVYYATASKTTGGTIYYRYGTLGSSGSVSWTISESSFGLTYTGVIDAFSIGITADSKGNLWIASESANSGAATWYDEVWECTTPLSSCTWLNKLTVNDGSSGGYFPELIALTAGKMAMVYGWDTVGLWVQTYSGSTWSSASAAPEGTNQDWVESSCAALKATIECAIVNGNSAQLNYQSISYNNNSPTWSSLGTTVVSGCTAQGGDTWGAISTNGGTDITISYACIGMTANDFLSEYPAAPFWIQDTTQSLISRMGEDLSWDSGSACVATTGMGGAKQYSSYDMEEYDMIFNLVSSNCGPNAGYVDFMVDLYFTGGTVVVHAKVYTWGDGSNSVTLNLGNAVVGTYTSSTTANQTITISSSNFGADLASFRYTDRHVNDLVQAALNWADYSGDLTPTSDATWNNFNQYVNGFASGGIYADIYAPIWSTPSGRTADGAPFYVTNYMFQDANTASWPKNIQPYFDCAEGYTVMYGFSSTGTLGSTRNYPYESKACRAGTDLFIALTSDDNLDPVLTGLHYAEQHTCADCTFQAQEYIGGSWSNLDLFGGTQSVWSPLQIAQWVESHNLLWGGTYPNYQLFGVESCINFLSFSFSCGGYGTGVRTGALLGLAALLCYKFGQSAQCPFADAFSYDLEQVQIPTTGIFTEGSTSYYRPQYAGGIEVAWDPLSSVVTSGIFYSFADAFNMPYEYDGVVPTNTETTLVAMGAMCTYMQLAYGATSCG